jgi:cell division control protein 6
MMKNIFGEQEELQSVFVNEEILLPQYLPEEISHREKEMEIIASSIKPLIKKKTPENLFIFGASGIGKTTCIKNILKQLKSYTSSIIPVYVNCWENNTQLAVYNRILEELRLPIPRRGLATDEVFDKIMSYLRAEDKRILIILDDMDGVKQNEELLFVLGRANEKGVYFGIIGVSNEKMLLARLDTRVRSSLRFMELEYKDYSEEQLVQILTKRAQMALKNGSFDQRIILKIARSVEKGSARVAIERLWRSARKAEKEGRDKIMLQDLEDLIEEESKFKNEELALTEKEKQIIEIIKNEKEIESRVLYEKLESKMQLSKRMIRNYIEELIRKKVIVAEEIDGEGMLKSRRFSIAK